MSDSDSLTSQNSSDLNDDIVNKLFISGSILPFNKDDLVDTNTRLGCSLFEVRQYRYNPAGLDIAVKRFPIPKRRGKNVKYMDKLIKEANILAQLKYSNDIVEFYGLCFDGDYALLCMELMDMNLSELNEIFFKIEGRFPFDMLPHIVVPIIDGLEYCHRKNIIHRDIKPNNILFNRSGKIKVGDFSESRELDTTITGDFMGTIPYWSPERVRSNEVKDPKYDIWGLGMTLLEIICGFHPYEKLLGQSPSIITLMQFIENIDPETLLQCAHIQKKYRYRYSYCFMDKRNYAHVLELISHCLKKVDERATIDDLKNTSYYKKAQEDGRNNEYLMKRRFGFYEKMNKTLLEENFSELGILIFEENSRRYNFDYSKLKFRSILIYLNNILDPEIQICYHTHADKWIVLKNYSKGSTSIEFTIRELAFLHKFVGQPFIPKFYGWGSIEHNNDSSYCMCLEVMDMNLRQFHSHFIKNFGSESFKDALSEGILGYISWVVLNALLEIHRKGFALHNTNSNNILLNDRGEVKLCGFTWAMTHEDTSIIYEYKSLDHCRNLRRNNCPSYPSDVWSYAVSLIEFACGRQPCWFYKSHDEYPQLIIFPEDEIGLNEMSKKCFSIGYSHQPHEFFVECLKQKKSQILMPL